MPKYFRSLVVLIILMCNLNIGHIFRRLHPNNMIGVLVCETAKVRESRICL